MATFNNTARPGTKRHTAAVIMTENGDKPMNDVLPLIQAAIGVTPAIARGYYVWLVENNFAPGTVPVSTRKGSVKTPVAPEATVAAITSSVSPEELKAEMSPSDEELESARRGEEQGEPVAPDFSDLRKELAQETAPEHATAS